MKTVILRVIPATLQNGGLCTLSKSSFVKNLLNVLPLSQFYKDDGHLYRLSESYQSLKTAIVNLICIDNTVLYIHFLNTFKYIVVLHFNCFLHIFK